MARASCSKAARDAALVAGATVVSADSLLVGTIKEIDAEADCVVVKRDSGLVTLKREHFAVDGNDALMALFTLAQLDGAKVATGG